MNNKSLPLFMLAISMWLIASLPFASATTPTTIPNIATIYSDSIGMPQTVDPGWLYDTASAELAMNVYDTLIFFDYEETDVFVPSLATDWAEVAPDPGFTKKIIFTIRDGVTFSTGAALTPEDIEYSFKRWMVLDRSGGPTWMIYEPLMARFHASHTWANDTSNPINLHVGSDADHVWFNFDGAYSNTIFYQVVAQSWAGIMDKDWAIAQGCWDGDWSHWLDYHDPAVSPLMDPSPVMMGSGPYKLTNIDYVGEKWELAYFAGHWGGWPSEGASGYAEKVVYTVVDEWASRKLRFLSNDAAAQSDLTYVPRANTPELEPEVTAGKVRYIKDLPTLSLSPALFFNFHIPNSTYVGNDSPYDGNELFSQGGIPWDFFADPDVRYGFAYAFNYDLFISDVFLGEADQPASPMIKGVGFDDLYDILNPTLKYTYDLAESENRMKAAWATRVSSDAGNPVGLWATGFTMTITYNTGNVARQTACNMLKSAMEDMNTKFHVTVQEVSWDQYLDDLVNWPVYKATMPIFLIGWLADYPDAHNFFMPFYHTQGDFTFFQAWEEYAPDEITVDQTTGAETQVANGIADCDERIEWGLKAPTFAGRESTYEKLMTSWREDLPTVPLIQGLGRHYERTWYQGWYYNPIFPGPYYYHHWKGLDADINADNVVNILDAGLISAHWYPGPPVGKLGYNRKADLGPVLAYPVDGKVNIQDAAIVNAYWGDTHP